MSNKLRSLKLIRYPWVKGTLKVALGSTIQGSRHIIRI